MVLEHLGNPLAALTEMKRVLKPKGVIGVRDVYHTGSFFEPTSPALEKFDDIYLKICNHNGGEVGSKNEPVW